MQNESPLHHQQYGVGGMPEFNYQAVGIDEFNKSIIDNVIEELKKE